MTRGQRRTHLRVWIILAVVLPVLIVAGLRARSGTGDPGSRAPSTETRP